MPGILNRALPAAAALAIILPATAAISQQPITLNLKLNGPAGLPFQMNIFDGDKKITLAEGQTTGKTIRVRVPHAKIRRTDRICVRTTQGVGYFKDGAGKRFIGTCQSMDDSEIIDGAIDFEARIYRK